MHKKRIDIEECVHCFMAEASCHGRMNQQVREKTEKGIIQ